MKIYAPVDGYIVAVNFSKALPEKDFKGRVQDGRLKEVSINIFDDDCYAFQPFYKLSKDDLLNWSNVVVDFINKGIDGVYAENALNTILDGMNICAKSYANNYIDEIDNLDDYARVCFEIDDFEAKINDGGKLCKRNKK